ncbi:uncharacterized protein LOC118416562 isoform X1 [Branchiostoma floridae]|uniref:Uncharacterized protein LOC118416562 isoform X1 n=1 Tax=Branchiostoma floridae TaxID=7739 RepID=A0A9J7L8H0_BRAFL|nr:uncharacterized protein LOC118416562 isoform X1 [Branchiostoma floridae]
MPWKSKQNVMSGGRGTQKGREKLHWQQVSPGRTPDTYIRYRRYGGTAAARWRWIDPQIVHVRVSPPESSLSLAEGQTSQDTEARGDQKKEQQAIPHRWQLTPQDEKTQALFNFNETALPPKSEFYPADENISEKLKLLYGESKVSPCCQKCSPCCCSCCVIQ